MGMPVEHTGNGNIDVPMPALSPLPKKSSLKKRSQSESDQTRRFSNSSLHEIDQQIVMIQNEFEAEPDTLIDTYRNIQQTSRKTKGETVTDAVILSRNNIANTTEHKLSTGSAVSAISAEAAET